MLCMKKVLVAVLCLGGASLVHGAVKIADLVTTCSLKDPQLDDCMTTQAKAILPQLLSGVQDLDVIPIDPLYVPKMVLQRTGGQFLSLNLTAKNTTHIGYKDVEVNSIRFDPKSFKLNLDLFFPWYNISGMYDMNGYLLLLPIRGNGELKKMNFQDCNMATTIQLEREKRDGDEYLKITDIKTISLIKRIVLQFDNLFGNQALSSTANNILNRNSQAVFAETKTDIQLILSEVTASVLSRMLAKIPLKELFKDVE